jgi:putative ABC transport system permease protein
MFALVDAILLRPLPFPDPDRLVKVWEQTPTTSRGAVSPLNLVDWNERSRTFERIAGFVPNVGGMVMADAEGTPETVPRQWVSSGIFDVLGITPVVGRTFRPSDDTQMATVVILSEAFWRTRFNADPGLVGRDLRLDGTPYTVVGVVPNEAQVIGRTSVWALGVQPFAAVPPPAMRGAHFAHAIGRLKPGVAFDAAGDDMTAVAGQLAREFPATNAGRGVSLEPLHEAVIGRELRITSMLFLGVVGLVLLICCANIANLLMTRATVRRRELALRSALGARRARVIRQLLTESLVLSAVGGVLGIAAGAAILSIAPSIVPPDLLPAVVTLSFDVRILAFCAVTTLIVGVLFGLAPAWQATKGSLTEAISAGSRIASARGGRTRAGLVVAQVATVVVLLFGGGLLLRTMFNLEGVDRGYRADDVLTMVVDAFDSQHGGPAGLLRFYEAVERELRARPGVRDVAWATTLPLGRSYQGEVSFEIPGEPMFDDNQRPSADYQVVSQTYFQTLDLPVVTGRPFDERDRFGAVPVCMVSEAFVRRYLQGRPPLGVEIAIRLGSDPDAKPSIRQIVGVARQVKSRPDETEEFVQIYVPLAQYAPGDIFLLVRPESGPAESLARPAADAIAQVDKAQLTSVRSVATLEDIAREATSRHRFRAVLVMTFATLALVLAMIGVFGVVAYAVEQRVRDFGVRRALGATTTDVLRLVAMSAGRLVTTGVIVGLALSLTLGRLVASLLFGVQPLDAMTFASVAMVIALTGAVSILGPAWRATRIDPVVALRAE